VRFFYPDTDYNGLVKLSKMALGNNENRDLKRAQTPFTSKNTVTLFHLFLPKLPLMREL
jgi:hypothetical protein